MKLTKERKVFLGVLGVAGAALLIDQVMLGPSGASAGQVLPAPSLGTGDPGLTAPAEAPSVDSLAHIASRIRAFASNNHEVGNAFEMPESWSPIEAAQAPEETAEARREPGDALVLSAVMPNPAGGVAIINGAAVRAGESIAGTGYRLLRVGAGFVVVTDGKRAVQLRMDDARYMTPRSESLAGRAGDDGLGEESQADRESLRSGP